MRDPLLIVTDDRPVPEKRLPDEAKLAWYGTPENPVPRSFEKLQGDVIRAFDDLHELRRKAHKDKDLILSELIATRRQLDRANLKIWLLSLIVSPFLGWLVGQFLHKAVSH